MIESDKSKMTLEEEEEEEEGGGGGGGGEEGEGVPDTEMERGGSRREASEDLSRSVTSEPGGSRGTHNALL